MSESKSGFRRPAESHRNVPARAHTSKPSTWKQSCVCVSFHAENPDESIVVYEEGDEASSESDSGEE